MKKYIFIFILIAFCNIAAADLIISPSSLDQTAIVGIEKKVELNFSNTYSFPIYNINFTQMEYVTTPTILTLNPNESKLINITLKTNASFSTKTINSVVKFYYLSEINLPSETHEINITNNGFIPQDKTIRINDKIKFTNIGNLSSVIKDGKNYFDKVVMVNQSVTVPQGADKPFSIEDDTFYYDLNDMTKVGAIHIRNKSQEITNNPEYNKIFTININSIFDTSELGVEIYPKNNVSIEYNGFTEVNVRVWNIGNKTAYGIKLNVNSKSEWFSFQNNNFDLSPDQNRFITLRITPQINDTVQTNKTYSIDVLAKGENTNEKTAKIYLFIPYTNQIQRIYYGADFWQEREEYCKEHPEDITCNPPPKVEKVIEYVTLNSTIEYSKEEALKNDREQNQRLTSIEDNQVKQTKSINDLMASINDFTVKLQNLSGSVGEYNSISNKAKESSESSIITFQLVITLFLLVTIFGVLIWNLKKKQKIDENLNNY